MYQFSRGVFTLINLDQFAGLSLGDFVKTAVAAVRFDLSALLLLNSLYILLLFFPGQYKAGKFLERLRNTLFIAVNSIALLFELSDWAYFPYNHKRATADVLSLLSRKGDFLNLLPGFLFTYWYIPLAAAFLICLLVRANRLICKHTPLREGVEDRILLQTLRLGIVVALCITGIRGGIQLVPIGLRDAAEATDSRYTAIVLNTPFSILYSMQNELKEELYYENNVLQQYINTTKQYTGKSFTKKNIVVIVLESFSKEFTGIGGRKSYTPFLDSLMQHSFVCTRAFANANRSADGIPAILAGIPSLQEEPFASSPYGANRISSLASLLAREGYSSTFYHGGTNGTMSFDNFAASAGFRHYVGRSEYPEPKDYDGNWGIWDEPFLQFAVKDIGTMKEPFCASVFTLSSHQPFAIPGKYKGVFPKGTLPIHESIGYTDNALRLFFKTAQKQSWYANTLFVLVADHCFALAEDDYYHYHQGRFAIPIVYFAPGDTALIGQTDTLTQQIDILPSVMEYVGYPDSFFAFGNSIFSPAPYRFTIQHWGGDILWTKDDLLLKVINGKPHGFYDTRADSLSTNDLMQYGDPRALESYKYLKAFRQAYTGALIRNRMWIP
ncbi:MAG TPA: LTA synthase family protein [Chitinophagaceae bacterium]|nr:LTA synthase family protein [Chitinophagaceae bacterium]